MTYEKGIPEYALQPAKAPQFTGAEAVYHTENMHYPVEKKVTEYEVEEDILVPDTKADMREILFMEACCDVTPGERHVMPKADEVFSLSGMITVQTLYCPEQEAANVETVTSRIPYKYAWNLNPKTQGEGVFSCRVKRVEHRIINERKFRVRITLEFCCRLFARTEYRFFDGLKDEELEMRREKIDFVCLDLVKQDLVSIDETFRPRDGDRIPERILRQSFSIVENYRQVTTEKVVMNGFLFVDLLYLSKGEEEKPVAVCEHQQRVEFTQFVPIDKAHRGKKWITVKPVFTARDFTVILENGEEDGEASCFRVKGDIDTRLELYGYKSQAIVVDAYHREKSFCCKYDSATFLNLAEGAIAEHSLREVIHLNDTGKAAEAVCCMGNILDCRCRGEKGKLWIEGSVEISCLWRDEEWHYHTTRQLVEFQTAVDMEHLEKGMLADCHPMMKSSHVTLINEKQLEVNCTLLLCCESYAQKELILLEEPGFSNVKPQRSYPMVVTALQRGETLWDLAKRYRTTVDQIRRVNRMESEPAVGQKILVMK